MTKHMIFYSILSSAVPLEVALQLCVYKEPLKSWSSNNKRFFSLSILFSFCLPLFESKSFVRAPNTKIRLKRIDSSKDVRVAELEGYRFPRDCHRSGVRAPQANYSRAFWRLFDWDDAVLQFYRGKPLLLLFMIPRWHNLNL